LGVFGVSLGAFIVLQGLLIGVSIVLWRLLLFLLGVFLSFLYGLARLLLCILPVYLGAPYAFYNEILLLIKKKRYTKKHNAISE
jgi:hypothetical protein